MRGTHVSSDFLYLAIVAIWAFVLVPRWLRRAHVQAPAQPEFVTEEHVDDDYSEHDDEWYAANPVPAPRPLPLPHSRAMQARRRLLFMLVLLAAAAGGCTAAKITQWWVCIPPVGMLGIYLLLLREAALADAEQARRRLAYELSVRAARQRAQEAMEAEMEMEPTAQIIDISARVGDQLYDQYADAAVRAVGD
jgi:hypothetical protein